MRNLYIFDFDGVIADTGADIAAAVQATQRHFGVPVMEAPEILKHVGYGAVHLVNKTAAPNPLDVTKEVLNWYKQYYFEHCVEKSVLYDGVREVLEELTERNEAVFMFSNKPGPVAHRSLELFGIKHYFSEILCPENLSNPKPHPEGILKCMELSGIPCERTLMIGDSAADIDAAHAAGVHSCGVIYGIGDTEKMLASGPDVTINTMRELLKIIPADL